MKTFYCVTSSYAHNRKTIANITDKVEAEQIPKNTFTHTIRADIYTDWFDSMEDAEKFAEDSRKV